MKKLFIFLFIFFSFISYSSAEYELDIENYNYTWTIKDKQLVSSFVNKVWKNDKLLSKLEKLKTTDKFKKLPNRYKYIVNEIIVSYKLKNKLLNWVTFWEWDDIITINNTFIAKDNYIWEVWYKSTELKEYALSLVYTWSWVYDFDFYSNDWDNQYIITWNSNYFYKTKKDEKIKVLYIPFTQKWSIKVLQNWKEVATIKTDNYFIPNISRLSDLYISYQWSITEKICNWKDNNWQKISIEQCLAIKISSTYNEAKEWMPYWLFNEIKNDWWYKLQISNSTYGDYYCKSDDSLNKKECLWVDEEVWEITTYYLK